MKTILALLSIVTFLLLSLDASARPGRLFDPEAREQAKTKGRFEAKSPHYRRDREVDILHVRVEIAPDLEKASYKASVTHRFKVITRTLRKLTFDAAELKILKVTDARGKPLVFRAKGEKLTITLKKSLKRGREATVRIDYTSTQSHLGLHFFKRDPRYPGQPDMVWSKGETERTRYWIPLYDYPNERASTEMIATVPEGFTAISNGRLVSTEPGKEPGTTRFHWSLERAHAPYLMTLSVGRFVPVVLQEGDEDNVPVTAWVLSGQEAAARRSLGKTPAMIDFYEDLFGLPYPWDKFDMVVAYGFRWGGMEDTSAIILAPYALLDERASLDYDVDGLLSHELTHQWFGNLVTCKDWSHMWLNEGFATYMEALWRKKDKGAYEFVDDMRSSARWYFWTKPRPMVSDRYNHSDNMFDAHSYAKGAWVLHML